MTKVAGLIKLRKWPRETLGVILLELPSSLSWERGVKNLGSHLIPPLPLHFLTPHLREEGLALSLWLSNV